MNKKMYFNIIWAKGYLCIGYSELKILGAITALVFARINTEYNFAVKHNYLIKSSWFAYEEKEIAVCLGLTLEEITTALNKLEELYFIKITTINSFKLMHVYLTSVYAHFDNIESEKNFKIWDHGLDPLQRSAFQSLEFENECNIHIPDPNEYLYEIATDENGNPLCF